MAQVVAKLIFRPGDSNREEYLVERDEITIGRSPDCQIVLSDKKASRKNTLIRRAGLQFSIKDLDSVNGTILNGITVTNAELTGDDVIQIGDTQFSFKVSNSEYHNNKNSFDSVSEVSEESSLLSPDIGGLSSDLSPGVFGSGGVHDSRGPDLASDGLSKLNGVLGLDSNKSQDRTPLQKLQDLPPKTWLYIAVVVGFAYMSRDDIMGFLQVQPQRPAVKASQKNVTAKPSGTPFNLSFEKLPLDKRNFVESQQNLGFEYYKSGDYDKAIFELEKIFTIVSDYKDSRDILRYAKEGKKKQESIAEEKRKKEQEQQLKEKISSLVDDARLMMREKKYDSARELFTEIMAIDPDNSSVIEWKKVLEQVDEQRRVQNQLLQVRREINAEGWRIYRQALANGRSEKYVSAIEILKRVLSTGVTEIKLKSAVAASIKEYNDQIAKLREPAFKEGQRLEASNDLGGAFKQFKKSTEIDPKFKEGYDAMSRIRGTLHDRAKTVYTEAIIAENYSDFETAEKLYKTCESLAPVDDVYHDRAVRKLSKFVSLHALKEMEAANSSTEQPSQPSVEASPGQTPLQTSGQDQAPGNPSQDSGTPGPTVSQEGVGEDPK
jgi:pSer/pThr/pTyr-binding forkhead associated (FHA) protein